jgi:hypothetical protein
MCRTSNLARRTLTVANDEVLISNPTPANITVNAQTVNAGRVVKLTVADTTTDLYAFVAKGCTVASASLTNGTGNVATPAIDNATTLAEKGARLMQAMVRAVTSAGSDAFAGKGL